LELLCLVKDTAPDVIPQSMQLIAGRTAQDYNQRKARKGAFWEDRYHATAIEGGGIQQGILRERR
jgi:putative transposase